MILRRALLLMLVLGCGACAVMNDPRFDGFEWRLSTRGELPVEWWAAGFDAVQTYCHHNPGWISNACAIYSAVCLIVAEREEAETPPWLVMHERKHCKGFDHS